MHSEQKWRMYEPIPIILWAHVLWCSDGDEFVFFRTEELQLHQIKPHTVLTLLYRTNSEQLHLSLSVTHTQGTAHNKTYLYSVLNDSFVE